MIEEAFKFHYVSINSLSSYIFQRLIYIFKFHYVSINSSGGKMNTETLPNFKFHYVSINSCPRRILVLQQ